MTELIKFIIINVVYLIFWDLRNLIIESVSAPIWSNDLFLMWLSETMTHNTVVAPRAGDIHLKTSLNVPLTMIPVIFSHSFSMCSLCQTPGWDLNTSHLSKHCFKSAICFTQSSLASSCIPSHSSLYLGSHYSPQLPLHYHYITPL